MDLERMHEVEGIAQNFGGGWGFTWVKDNEGKDVYAALFGPQDTYEDNVKKKAEFSNNKLQQASRGDVEFRTGKFKYGHEIKWGFYIHEIKENFLLD